jgi:nucleoside-diphosphate-sugar epimerase
LRLHHEKNTRCVYLVTGGAGFIGSNLVQALVARRRRPARCDNGDTALLVPHSDPAAMAKAVMTLLENPDQALRMVRRAWEEVQKHTWRQVGRDWAAVYVGRAA